MTVTLVEGLRSVTFNVGVSELAAALKAAEKADHGVVTLRVTDARIGDVVELVAEDGEIVNITDYETW